MHEELAGQKNNFFQGYNNGFKEGYEKALIQIYDGIKYHTDNGHKVISTAWLLDLLESLKEKK